MANKKINQLVSKNAILSTDIFGIGDATTGQLFKKTIAELQAAIGGAVISVNGLVGTVVLDTDDVQELASPTNKYFTDARARGAISLTVTGNSGASTYSSGTGVINVPTYTLAGLGGITAAFLSGTSGISYNSSTGVISYSGTVYTDASIRALLSGSTGITYNSSTGAISYSGTVYTDSSVRALISLTTTGTSGASTYNNTTGVINVPEYTLAGLGGITASFLSGGTGITYNSSTGAISYSGTVYTDASIRALFSASGSVTYNNTTGVISLTGGNLTEATSSVLTITGGSGAVIGGGTSIQVKQATTSVSGFLSSTDWTTFNNKQATITLTTTGTSGAATFSSNTLNIPNYGSALSGYLPLTGGTLTGALGGTSATFSGAITSKDVYITNSANADVLEIFQSPSVLNSFIDYPSGRSLILRNKGTAGGLTLASTGAATFSSSVTSDDLILTAGTLFSAGNTGFSNRLSDTTLYLQMPATGFNITDNALNTRFILSSTGAATFSSSVTSQANGSAFGTASATGRAVTIQAGSTNQAIRFQNPAGGDGTLYINGTSTSVDYNFNTYSVGDALVIKNSGNVGIGTTTPDVTGFGWTTLTIKGGTTSGSAGVLELQSPTTTGAGNLGVIAFLDGSNRNAQISVQRDTSTSTGNMMFYTNAGAGIVERMRITSGGNILMGTTSDNGERLYVSGAIRATGTITANSDLTLKKNLLKIENALEKVEQINGYTYEFKEDDSKRYAGVIAQEIQTVLPEIVNKGNDGILGVEYGNISALLIEAIKEQNIKIKNLETLLASK